MIISAVIFALVLGTFILALSMLFYLLMDETDGDPEKLPRGGKIHANRSSNRAAQYIEKFKY